MSRDVVLFGSAEAYFMAEEDENAARMIPLNCKDRGTPCQPIGPSRPVRHGGIGEGDREFILASEERNRRPT